ncbi:MAG: hypothetical protein EXR52_04800 [Dehalococcoidia bacterium]|nr:hypothetical protein [Dehalococcoidia bacterium]
MRYTVVLQPEETGYSVTCPAVSGAVSQGETLDEALLGIVEAVEGLLESLLEDGETPPAETLAMIAEEITIVLAERAEDGLPLTIETKEIEVRLPAPV